MVVEKLIKENSNRLKELNSPYDPVSGLGSPIPRKELSFINVDGTVKKMLLPVEMFSHELVVEIEKHKDVRVLIALLYKGATNKFVKNFIQVRFKYDFEYWAFTTVKIQDKRTKQEIPFKLNKPQRKLLKKLEELRTAGTPIRIILLKARQWGGSTLVQIYMGYLQIIHKMNWHSTVVADVENQARKIKAMYSRLIRNYPKEYGNLTLRNFEGSSKVKIISERGCTIGIGSAQKPDGLRGDDQAMVHETEVAFWKQTEGKSPEDLAQTIGSLVPDEPDTMIIKESTAKGVGNYFHKEYLAAEGGTSGYSAVFIAWFEIEMYTKEIKNYPLFIKSLSEYEEFLWESGATLEGIAWYRHHKAIERYDDWRMQSEYPTNAIEAFQSTGRRAFAPNYVARTRKFNTPPFLKGEIFADAAFGKEAFKNIEFQPMANGDLWVWALPDKSITMTNRYVVPVDIGGRTDKADYSIIRVVDRYPILEGGVPEVILTWRSHLDQDLVIWKAAQIAKYYNDALLIPEVNSLDKDEDSEGEQLLTLLDELSGIYRNIFCRNNPEKIREGVPLLYGFHTNKATKPMIITLLNKALREYGYIEYDARVCDEYDSYEIKPNGSYGAVEGAKDDLVMATAIGIWAATSYMPLPKLVEQRKKSRITSVSEASI